jgi:tRNA pseudouridine13 synthase
LRIKTVPEDFLVVERLSVQPKARGPYALYRVEKRNITTLEAAQILSHALKVKPSAIAFPALKDKVAVAIQHCTVKISAFPIPKEIQTTAIAAKLLGYLDRHLSPKDLAENKFTVTVRGISREEVELIRERFLLLGHQGFPNYFDLQRFGSWSRSLGFPGKLLLLGEWEGVLRAYLAEPLLGDPPAVLRLKKLARENWRNWPLLKEHASKANLRSVLTFLCDHPENFKRAVNLITPRILSLWLSAYQSFLWNRVASLVLERLLPEKTRLEYPFGELVFPRWPLPPEVLAYLKSLEIPLPSARAKTEGIVAEAFSQVLAEKGLRPEMLKARGLERAFLTKGKRPLWVVPKEPAILGEGEDELFPGHRKLVLSFALPPGSYATLFLRLLGKEFGGGENHA